MKIPMQFDASLLANKEWVADILLNRKVEAEDGRTATTRMWMGKLQFVWSDGARENVTAAHSGKFLWEIPDTMVMTDKERDRLAAQGHRFEEIGTAPAATDDIGAILAKCPPWARSTVARSLGVETVEMRDEREAAAAKAARTAQLQNVGAIVSGKSAEPLKPVAGNPGSANAAPALSKADRVKQLQQIGKAATPS